MKPKVQLERLPVPLPWQRHDNFASSSSPRLVLAGAFSGRDEAAERRPQWCWGTGWRSEQMTLMLCPTFASCHKPTWPVRSL